MKIIKISALWCGACLITNKVWKKVKENYTLETIELDYDMDEEEVKKYNPGNILPVFIFLKEEKEISRLVGEVSYEDFVKKIEEVEKK